MWRYGRNSRRIGTSCLLQSVLYVCHGNIVYLARRTGNQFRSNCSSSFSILSRDRLMQRHHGPQHLYPFQLHSYLRGRREPEDILRLHRTHSECLKYCSGFQSPCLPRSAEHIHTHEKMSTNIVALAKFRRRKLSKRGKVEEFLHKGEGGKQQNNENKKKVYARENLTVPYLSPFHDDCERKQDQTP